MWKDEIRFIKEDDVIVFSESDIDNIFKDHNYSQEYGRVVHNGVMVLFDKDRDIRVFDLVDDMTVSQRKNLMVVHETEGWVSFLWYADDRPHRFRTGKHAYSPKDGDAWKIRESLISCNTRVYDGITYYEGR